MQDKSRKKNITQKTWFHMLPAVILGLLLAAVLLYGNTRLISAHNEEEERQTARLVGLLREKLPDAWRLFPCESFGRLENEK